MSATSNTQRHRCPKIKLVGSFGVFQWSNALYLGTKMPDLNSNKECWGGLYHWANGGEEWSASWGGSEAQWFGSIYPRLIAFCRRGGY